MFYNRLLKTTRLPRLDILITYISAKKHDPLLPHLNKTLIKFNENSFLIERKGVTVNVMCNTSTCIYLSTE